MNPNELEAAAEERLFFAMLDEVLREPRRASDHRSRWLLAAAVLLGVAAVVGVMVTARERTATATAPQEPAPMPPAIEVRGRAALDALDRSTQNVRFRLGTVDDLATVARLTRLRGLTVEPAPDWSNEGRANALVSLEPLTACAHLEQLSIGCFGTFTAAQLSPLCRVPRLRSLTLIGRDKRLDADAVSLLAKVPLRALSLESLRIEPEGMAALGDLPLLERLEVRDCDGLVQCDMQALYHLRQLRSLTLAGLGASFRPMQTSHSPGKPVSIQLPETRDGKFVERVDGGWMVGLVKALPGLRELDLSNCRIDDEVLAALPDRLESLSLHSSIGYGTQGVNAVAALPKLHSLTIGEQRSVFQVGEAPLFLWSRVLPQMHLHRFGFVGDPKAMVEAVRGQVDLVELSMDECAMLARIFSIDDPLPDLTCLGQLPKLARIELVDPSPAFEQAIRTAVPARVQVEILNR